MCKVGHCKVRARWAMCMCVCCSVSIVLCGMIQSRRFFSLSLTLSPIRSSLASPSLLGQ